MLVNYLSADVRLSKTFEEIAPGTYKETSYPHVAKFTSVEREINGLPDFIHHGIAAASEGMCLLKGRLDRPINSESRASLTDSSAETQWICLDVDYTVTDKSPEEFLDDLDPVFQGVSFVFQFSASHGIKTHDGWRGHFFLLLESAQPPPVLKAWLISLNLGKLPLSSKLKLSASGGALIYPLDVTTCQNDKLIYIAPPTCISFEDPVTDRFVYFEREKDRLDLDLSKISAVHNATETKNRIVELRSHSKLPAKTFKTTFDLNHEVLTNPDPVTVTGKKEERGFVYLNLNGGDSWAYYFPVNQPDILFNFKGEPCMYMQDVDSDLFKQYKPASSLPSEGAQPFGFLWPSDDTYYRGFANPVTGELLKIDPTGSLIKLKHFLIQSGSSIPKGWTVPQWELEFNPMEEGKVDFDARTVNTYKSTQYMRQSSSPAGIPAVIDRVLTSVCTNEETKNYFLNWLASIFQTRRKTMTGWIFQGVQGTGKGVLYSRIISPLIGERYCHEMTMDRLDDDFNRYLAENIILFIDEANISDSRNGDRLLNRIKNLITEPKQHIRAMRSNAVLRNNYSNVILASNYDEIIPLEGTDRRFNVAPRQETPLPLEFADIQTINDQLPDFASYLRSFAVNQEATQRVMLNEARETLIDLSKTTVDAFFHAVRAGDLAYFTQYIDRSVKTDMESIRYHDFSAVVQRWVDTVGNPTNVSRAELKTVYQYLQNVVISTTKFSRMCNKYALDMVPVRINGEVTRGIYGVAWLLDTVELEYQQENSNVAPFGKIK